MVHEVVGNKIKEAYTDSGYVNPHGNITGWLNELAFAPVDYCEEAMVDEWSGDSG